MTELEKLIADSIAEQRRRDADEKARRDADEAAHQARLDAMVADHLRKLGDAIPAPLLPFVRYGGDDPGAEWLKEHAANWWPTEFVIDAPGLSRIKFETELTGAETARVRWIRTADHIFYGDWTAAIATAAEEARRQQEWEAECEARARMREQAEPKPPTLAERLESAIREIVGDEIASREEA